MKIIFTDEDLEFEEDGEKFKLSEETGWWDANGNIYIWKKLPKIQQFGVLIHEVVEYLLIKCKIPRKTAHNMASMIEKILTLGKSTSPKQEQKLCKDCKHFKRKMLATYYCDLESPSKTILSEVHPLQNACPKFEKRK